PSSCNNETRKLPLKAGSIAIRKQGGLLLAMSNGFYNYDFKNEILESRECDPEPDRKDNRLNDGRCDPGGRFWVGSMNDLKRIKGNYDGNLYCYHPDGECVSQNLPVGVANGLAFSPDERYMFFADTMRETVWRFDYDKDQGKIWNQQVFLNLKNLPGKPDGACVDADGCYWLAHIYGWKVARYTPKGKLDREIQLPFPKPSMCAFGGSKLDTLFITSISTKHDKSNGENKYSGGLFAVNPGVSGIPEPNFSA
ncbi:MAG: SMP-30/gluconolactonase/LRE family protein, partial [SAR324 cluster bacterium]|nr:SMP-30/gluconolactonase/LRE family protein [SAR324 cluster bacterium]